MRNFGPLALLSAGGLVLLLLILVPHASAQVPPVPGTGNLTGPVGFAISCQQAFIQVDYLGTSRVTCTIYDMTKDSLNGGGVPTTTPGAAPHSVTLSYGGASPAGFHGWVVNLGQNFFPLYGGQTADATITVQNTPQIDVSDYAFNVTFTYDSPELKANQTVQFHAKVAAYYIAVFTQKTFHRDVGQDEITTFDMQIDNAGVFPDTYSFAVQAPAILKVASPASVYVPPHESRNVTVRVLSPSNTVYELGRSYSLGFKATSTRGSAIYSTSASLHVAGAYIPDYWAPLALVGLVAAVVVTRRTRETVQTRRLEAGRPRRVEITPRQAVLLAELKRTDPAAYQERRAQLAAIYAGRRERYRDARKVQLAKDREERRIARAEFNERKRAAKAEKKAAQAQHNADKKAAKVQRKLDQKAAKIDAKELRKKEKVLGKKRAVLDKALAKQAVKDAKQAAKDAKLQAKADAAAAKEEKAAARAAKRAAKKGEGPPPPGQ